MNKNNTNDKKKRRKKLNKLINTSNKKKKKTNGNKFKIKMLIRGLIKLLRFIATNEDVK